MDSAVQYSGSFTYNLVGMQAFEFFSRKRFDIFTGILKISLTFYH